MQEGRSGKEVAEYFKGEVEEGRNESFNNPFARVFCASLAGNGCIVVQDDLPRN